MKKTTIALLTAAAMGATSVAVAESTGPDFSGRVDIRFTDVDKVVDSNDETLLRNSGELDATNASSKLAVTGSTDELVGGLTTDYYARLALAESGGADVDYIYVGLNGAFGRLQAGIDDDLAYKFVGAKTDLHRGLNPTGAALYADGNAASFGTEPSLQYHLDTGAFTVAAYVDTADAGNDGLTDDELNVTASEGGFSFEDADGDISAPANQSTGIDHTQLGVHTNVGPLALGAVYSDRDIADYDAEFAIGATLDMGVASLAATFAESTGNNNPYNVAIQAPLTSVLTGTLAYGDNDESGADAATDTTAQIRANLGGGVEINTAYRSGDSGDGFVVGARYSF
jgi:hypothetical protein